MGLGLAIAGLALTSAASLHYLWLIPREAVPEQPRLHPVGLAGGAVLAWIGVGLGSLWPGLAAAALASVIAALHVHTIAHRHVPPPSLQVVVGQPLPPIQLLDEQGQPVSSESWRGQRLLLKVFRGHW